MNKNYLWVSFGVTLHQSGIIARMEADGNGNDGLRGDDQEARAPFGDEALQRLEWGLEQRLEQRIDLIFRRFEGRFDEIVDRLDALGLDAHRRQNGNRRPGVEVAHGDPIDRPVPVRMQPIYEEDDSEEEDDYEPNRFGHRPAYENRRGRYNYRDDDRDVGDFRL